LKSGLDFSSANCASERSAWMEFMRWFVLCRLLTAASKHENQRDWQASGLYSALRLKARAIKPSPTNKSSVAPSGVRQK
jgi:hypothetical protein